MGQLQTFLNSKREFERLENTSTPQPKKQLDDPRSPSKGVDRTPIEANNSTPAKSESDSPSTRLLSSKGTKSLKDRLLTRRFIGSESRS